MRSRVFQAAFTILEALAEVISVIGGMGLLIDAPQFVLKYIIFGKYGDAAPKVRGIFASYRAILPLWMIRRYPQTRVTRVYFEFFTRSHLYFSFGQVGFHLDSLLLVLTINLKIFAQGGFEKYV